MVLRLTDATQRAPEVFDGHEGFDWIPLPVEWQSTAHCRKFTQGPQWGSVVFSSGSWRKASTCKRTAWKSTCYICCNRIRLYFSRLYVYFRFDLWWGENLPLLKVSTLLHLYCRTTPFGTLTLLCGWHQALVHERIIFLLCSGVLLILVQFLFFFPIYFEK